MLCIFYGAMGQRAPRRCCTSVVVLASPAANTLFVLLQRLLGEHEEVHLSALGMAVSTMVSIVEILKKDGLAVETSKQHHSTAAQDAAHQASSSCCDRL